MKEKELITHLGWAFASLLVGAMCFAVGSDAGFNRGVALGKQIAPNKVEIRYIDTIRYSSDTIKSRLTWGNPDSTGHWPHIIDNNN